MILTLACKECHRMSHRGKDAELELSHDRHNLKINNHCQTLM